MSGNDPFQDDRLGTDVCRLIQHYIDDSVVWDEIREYYSHKKMEWAKTKSYYGDRNKDWGMETRSETNETYSYELKPPYTKVEVANFEKTANIVLPRELVYYLTNISRELFLGSYPRIFNIKLTEEQIGTFEVPLDKDMWCYGDCPVHGSYDELPDDGCECDDPTDGVVKIADSGCTDVDYLVVKGNHYGTIWSCGGGGDYVYAHYRYKNFWEFLTGPITRRRKKEARKDRQLTPQELRDYALAYRFLRIMSGGGGLHYDN
jgi:hypothetical protein